MRDERPGREEAGCAGEDGRRRHRRRHRRRTGRERKERILHTRISEALAEDIRRVAEDLRVPVSNLVRNVLEEAFSVVEAVTDNVGDWIEEVAEEAERARGRTHRRRAQGPPPGSPAEPGAEPPAASSEADDAPDVIGWQRLILERARACADCGQPLARGARAWVGVTARGIGDPLVCPDCARGRSLG